MPRDPIATTDQLVTRLVGVGSPHGDDRVGWVVVDRLAALRLAHVQAVTVASPIGLLDLLGGAGERLIVCDAFAGEGPAGRLRRWEWPDAAIESVRSFGTHDVSLATALQLAGNLGILPLSVTVWGIDVGPSPRSDPCGSAAGEPSLSATLESAVGRLVRQLAREVDGA